MLISKKPCFTKWRSPARCPERMKRQNGMNLFSTCAAGEDTARRNRRALLIAMTGAAVAFCAVLAQAAETRKEARFEIANGGNVDVVNASGSVTLHSAPGHQVIVSYTTHSDKIEVDQAAPANRQRIELRTHALAGQKPTAEEAQVDYDIAVPPGISVSVNTVSAPVTVDGLSGDLTLSSETGRMTVRNVSRLHLYARSMAAPVVLSNVTAARINVASSGGAVTLENVTGPRVVVGTASGNIDYRGNCSGGSYIMTTHSGDISLLLPPTAAVDLTARSNKGSVDNEFPL